MFAAIVDDIVLYIVSAMPLSDITTVVWLHSKIEQVPADRFRGPLPVAPPMPADPVLA